MNLKFVYGRSGTGKSHYIYQDIKKRLTSSYANHQNIWIIVPEQSNLSAERKLFEVTHQKSFVHVEVLTLSRMAYRVLALVGKQENHLSKVGKDMLIYDVLSREKKHLKFLGKSEKNVDIVNRMFTELKKHCMTVEDLKEVKIEDTYTQLKVADITKLYEKYTNKLEKQYIDENDMLTVLAEHLHETDMFENSIIYVDEFLGLTPQEYVILEKLMQVCNQMTITVTTDSLQQNASKENDIFYFNKQYALKLLEIGKKQGAEIEEILLDKPYRFQNEELQYLEENYTHFQKIYEKENQHIHLFLANNPYTELEYVAQTIFQLVKEHGYAYHEIGVIAEDIEAYAEDAKVVFAKYAIPLFVDEKKDFNQNILVKFVIAMLDIFSNRWSYEAVFQYLKIGLLSIPLEDIFVLENYCLKWGIKGTKWQKPFTYEPLNDQQERLENLRIQIVEPLLAFQKKVSENHTVLEMTQGLYAFLMEQKVYEVLDAKIKWFQSQEISDEYNTSYQLFLNILEEMCLLFGEDKITFQKYKEILQVGVNATELGKIPATQDQVILGDTERTRSHKLKVVFMIGANDGTFPKANTVEGYLNDHDREILETAGIKLAKNALDSLYEEQFNVYRTLTTPEEELYISYVSSDKQGKSVRPSTLLKRLKRTFKNLKEESDIIHPRHIMTNELATFEEALTVYKAFLDGEPLSQSWKEILCYMYQKDPIRLENAMRGMQYTNVAQDLSKENILKLYGNTLYTSVSRLEAYRRCPFSFHLTYGLKLKEKEMLRMNFMDTGSFMHEVIDAFFKYLEENEISVKKITKEDMTTIIEKIVEEMLSSSKYYVLTSSAKFKMLTKRLKKVVLESLEYIVYTLQHSDFSILGHELEFSHKGDYAPITLSVEDKKIEITGKIDRVDTAKLSDQQYVRIIDYKSSAKDIDLNQVISGLQIQLITYLDAITEQQNFNPSGILYLGLKDYVVQATKNLSEEEIAAQIRKKFRMNGIILADVSVIKMMDNTLETGSSDIIPAYITKEGNIRKDRSSTIQKDDFQRLNAKVREVIQEIAREILKGKISMKPYYYKQQTGCDYCSYKTICMFHSNLKDNTYWYVPNQTKEWILEELKNHK